jgi:hypothetical protein
MLSKSLYSTVVKVVTVMVIVMMVMVTVMVVHRRIKSK